MGTQSISAALHLKNLVKVDQLFDYDVMFELSFLTHMQTSTRETSCKYKDFIETKIVW